MKPCQNCGRTLASTNARYCRTCYRHGLRVRQARQPKPSEATREPLLFWRAA